MASKKQPFDLVRRSPSQARAAKTLEAFYEATAQILEHEGEGKLTTNRIADRAGFSVGTLYQYFPNKDALLVAMAERERKRVVALIHKKLGESDQLAPEEIVRHVVRLMLQVFKGRFRARLGVQKAVDNRNMAFLFTQTADEMTKIIDAEIRRSDSRQLRALSEAAMFVVSRALLGVIRYAVVEQSPLLATQAFEDELVTLICGFLQ